MTKTMKKVFMLALIFVMAMTAFAGVTFASEKALAYSANAEKFIEIVETFTGVTGEEDNSITDEDLVDATGAVQAKLIEAYGYRIKIDKDEYANLPSEIVTEWEYIYTIAGKALSVYADMADLYPYLHETNPVRIAASRRAFIEGLILCNQV